MGEVLVVGLGPGGADGLPAVNREALRGADDLVGDLWHPAVAEEVAVSPRGSSATGCEDRVARLRSSARAGRRAVWAVAGDPLTEAPEVGPAVAALQAEGLRVRVLPAQGYAAAACLILGLPPGVPRLVVAGEVATKEPPLTHYDLVVVCRYPVDGEKLRRHLLLFYPPAHETAVVTLVGERGVHRAQVSALADHLRETPCAIYVPSWPRAEGGVPLAAFLRVVERLRGEGGCPWDRAQTHASLRRFVLEEAYEVVEAIDRADVHNLAEELGDLLLQVVLHAVIAAERGDFRFGDVVAAVTRKMVRRHPHVFGDEGEGLTAGEVLARWEALKAAERGDGHGGAGSLLDGVPGSLPALAEAEAIQTKVARVGLDRATTADAWRMARRREEELRASVEGGGDRRVTEAEWGDWLFALVGVARRLGIHSELALKGANRRFRERCRALEELTRRQGGALSNQGETAVEWLWEPKGRTSQNLTE